MNTNEMLESVRDFQREYVMTEAEAKSLTDTSNVNRPKITVRSCPPAIREDV